MSRTRPDVTVIIPCYRGEAFIVDAVASVLAQTGGAVEVVVVDDASPDAAVARVEEMNDERIRIVRHETNRGIGAARNSGLAAATADLVAFLDQDDLWLEDRLALQLETLRARAADGVELVFGDVVVRDERGFEWTSRSRIPEPAYRLSPTALLAALVAGDFPPLGSILVRRETVRRAGGFDETIRGGTDDFDLVVRLAEQCRFAGVGRAVYVRRLHGGNYTSARRMADEALAVIGRVEARHPEVAHAARTGRGRQLYRRAVERHLAGDRAGAAADYRDAARARPWNVRIWLGRLLCGLGPVGDALVRRWVRARGGRTAGV